MWFVQGVYKMLQCRHIRVLFASIFAILINLKVIEKFQGNKTVRVIVFHLGKFCSIRPRKFHTQIFGRMESAPIVFSVFLVLLFFCPFVLYRFTSTVSSTANKSRFNL